MATARVPVCPDCDGTLKVGVMALCQREDDGKLTCRMVWGCANQHVWWHWADRPEGPLEPCPYPDLLDD